MTGLYCWGTFIATSTIQLFMVTNLKMGMILAPILALILVLMLAMILEY